METNYKNLLRVRLTDRQSERLQRLSEMKGTTIADYARKLIDKEGIEVFETGKAPLQGYEELKRESEENININGVH